MLPFPLAAEAEKRPSSVAEHTAADRDEYRKLSDVVDHYQNTVVNLIYDQKAGPVPREVMDAFQGLNDAYRNLLQFVSTKSNHLPSNYLTIYVYTVLIIHLLMLLLPQFINRNFKMVQSTSSDKVQQLEPRHRHLKEAWDFLVLLAVTLLVGAVLFPVAVFFCPGLVLECFHALDKLSGGLFVRLVERALTPVQAVET